MILGIGTDIVDQRRIERSVTRFGPRFLERVFTRAEQSQAPAGKRGSSYLAKRFAAKEAIYKALEGAGIEGLGWREAEITNNRRGAPRVKLDGRCKSALERLTPDGYRATVDISLSDETPYAVAFVVVWAGRADDGARELAQ